MLALSPQDALALARAQFAVNLTVHILFPAITLALGWIVLGLRIGHALRGRGSSGEAWGEAARLWTRVYTLAFAAMMATGLWMTLQHQFATNWPGFNALAGEVTFSLLGPKGLYTFAVETAAVLVMQVGEGRLGPWLRAAATLVVAASNTFSAYWVLALNAWMQSPAGVRLVEGRLEVVDFAAVAWAPTLPVRLVHTGLSSLLTCAFLLAGLSAWQRLRGDLRPAVDLALRTGLLLAAFAAPLQLVAGDLHVRSTREHQPQKFAAFEGLPTSGPDAAAGIPPSEPPHPAAARVRWSFLTMVATGLAMAAVAGAGAVVLLRRRALTPRYLRILTGMTFTGWLGTVTGWHVAEQGRQPWLIQGYLRVHDAGASPASPVGEAFIALALLVYLAAVLGFVRALYRLATCAPPSSPRSPAA